MQKAYGTPFEHVTPEHAFSMTHSQHTCDFEQGAPGRLLCATTQLEATGFGDYSECGTPDGLSCSKPAKKTLDIFRLAEEIKGHPGPPPLPP